MNSNTFFSGAWSFALVTSGISMASSACANSSTGQNENPNIVIVLADDLGWGDVGFHGSDIKTPNLDLLAESAIQLNRFYVAPISSPTRAGLLTGRYPNRMGVRHVVIPPWRDYGIEPEEIFLPQSLKKQTTNTVRSLGNGIWGIPKKYYPLNKGFSIFTVT